MANEWTAAWAEAQAAVPANIIQLYALELLHPAFLDGDGLPTSVRAVNDTQDHNLLLESSAPLDPSETVTFTGIPFEMPWPEQSEGQAPELTIKIDGVGRELMPWLDVAVTMQSPVTVVLRVYLFDTVAGTKVAGITPMSFPLRRVTINETFVEGSASPADLANLRALRLVYDLKTYPALDLAS